MEPYLAPISEDREDDGDENFSLIKEMETSNGVT
jgi:hypothetical protein